MKFNINNYKGKYVMHCKTEEEANNFLAYLDSVGRKWCTGESYKNRTSYDMYEEDTCYYFNEGSYCNIDWFRENNYTILEWSDFMEFTKEDLRTGDVVMRRNGQVEIVNRDLGMFITENGWNDLDDINEDLTEPRNSNWDIVAVRRPGCKGNCQFKAFKHKWGTLVYKRKEVEEMTLAEVCKLLGKEIKIVK